MELPLFSKAVQQKFAKDEGALLRQRTTFKVFFFPKASEK